MTWVESPVRLLRIAVCLSTLSAGAWWGVLWSGFLFYPENTTGCGIITLAKAVLLALAGGLARLDRRRTASILAVVGSTFAAGLILVTLTFSQVGGIQG